MTNEEHDLLRDIREKLAELLEWKKKMEALMNGDPTGGLGYFQKSNIVWKMLVIWPLCTCSAIFGSVLTWAIIHYASSK